MLQQFLAYPRPGADTLTLRQLSFDQRRMLHKLCNGAGPHNLVHYTVDEDFIIDRVPAPIRGPQTDLRHKLIRGFSKKVFDYAGACKFNWEKKYLRGK